MCDTLVHKHYLQGWSRTGTSSFLNSTWAKTLRERRADDMKTRRWISEYDWQHLVAFVYVWTRWLVQSRPWWSHMTARQNLCLFLFWMEWWWWGGADVRTSPVCTPLLGVRKRGNVIRFKSWALSLAWASKKWFKQEKVLKFWIWRKATRSGFEPAGKWI